MIRHWRAVEGDLAARYHTAPEDIAAMTPRRFLTLLAGLPPESRFAEAWRSTPRRVTDPAEIARLTGQ